MGVEQIHNRPPSKPHRLIIRPKTTISPSCFDSRLVNRYQSCRSLRPARDMARNRRIIKRCTTSRAGHPAREEVASAVDREAVVEGDSHILNPRTSSRSVSQRQSRPKSGTICLRLVKLSQRRDSSLACSRQTLQSQLGGHQLLLCFRLHTNLRLMTEQALVQTTTGHMKDRTKR